MFSWEPRHVGDGRKDWVAEVLTPITSKEQDTYMYQSCQRSEEKMVTQCRGSKKMCIDSDDADVYAQVGVHSRASGLEMRRSSDDGPSRRKDTDKIRTNDLFLFISSFFHMLVL